MAMVLAAGVVIAPLAVSAADASPYWPPVTNNCGQKYVQINFHTTGGLVQVGYASSPQGDYWNGPYWAFSSAGSYTRNPGFHTLTWQKWASTGDVSQWSYTCVSYA
jgi:hypothetical protein